MPKVSVIVPVYNSALYIDKCFKSIQNQTFRDIEIILVDDGSTDNTPQILESYAQKDSRVVVIRQQNSKQGAARNTGLRFAKGEFITFIDSDDWIDSNYIEKLYSAMVKYNVNLAIPSIIREKKNNSRKMLKINKEEVIYGANEILKAINWELVSHSKMYRLEPVKNLKFQEQVFYEDAPYTLKAIDLLKCAVLIPDVSYHYFSRGNSTIKSKHNEADRNDVIETQLDLIKYANEHNLVLKNNLICKDSNLFFKTKYFADKTEYYVFGLKVLTKKTNFNSQKIFVIIQLQCFGDNLCCNSLVQNIKTMFPESKIIFVVDKPWIDAAKYQKDVDEVFVFDKKGLHKGLWGIVKFVWKFPYKKIDYILQLTKNERIWLISKLLHPRRHFIENERIQNIKIIDRHCEVLKKISHKHIIEYPLTYIMNDDIPPKFKDIIIKGKKYAAICTTTKLEKKDMNISEVLSLINKLGKKYEVIFTGAGEKARMQAQELENKGCKFINLVNKTSIPELAQVLKNCAGVISVDTGTMHFAYANNVPVLCVFNEKGAIPYWAPNEKLYKAKTVTSDIGIERICQTFERLMEEYDL